MIIGKEIWHVPIYYRLQIMFGYSAYQPPGGTRSLYFGPLWPSNECVTITTGPIPVQARQLFQDKSVIELKLNY